MLRRLAQALSAHPRRVVAVAAVVVVAAAVFGIPVVRILVPAQSDFNDPGSPSGHVEKLLGDGGLAPPGGIVVMLKTKHDAWFDSATRSRVAQVSRTLAADPDVASTRSMLTPRSEALVSRDGHATYVVANLRKLPPSGSQATVRRVRSKLEPIPGATLGGTAVAYEEMGTQSEHDLIRAE